MQTISSVEPIAQASYKTPTITPSEKKTTASSEIQSAAGDLSISPAAAEKTAGMFLDVVYSTSVAGKDYSSSIEQTDGEYVASVPNLPLATATGSTIEETESNLGRVIDTLA